MKALEVYREKKEELIEKTLELMPTALSGDRANITFFFKVDEETGELTVDYLYYLGQQYLSENCFYTIPDYEIPDAEEYGFDSIEEMDFDDCGYREFIEHDIENMILHLELSE